MRFKSSLPKSLFAGLLGLVGSHSFAAPAAAPAAAAPTPEPIKAYEWMPEGADGAQLQEAQSPNGQVVLPVIETAIPKATADASKFTREVVIDLKKFGISNDGTNAEATSHGLNAALQDARKNGANRIVFPKGTYLISEKEPLLLNLQNTIVDLNGSTLQMNTNGLPDYSMVIVADEAQGMRLTNGTLRGDRDTHDYKTIKSTHEHCRLLRFAGGSELEIDHLTVAEAPGFAVTTTPMGGTAGRPGLLAMIFHGVMIKDLESGAFSDDGQKVADPHRVRSQKAYDVSKCGGEFEFGWTQGYMGFPFIKDRNYQTLFYDADMHFMKKEKCLQYKKITVPKGAKFVKLEFNQPEVSPETNHPGAPNHSKMCGRITNFRPPRDVYFHDNAMIHNRGLGMAFTGGLKWVIENNRFEKNGGTAPSFGIDFEDGWDMMQNVVLRKNTFKDNGNDLVVCAGTELLFEDNQFQKAVIVSGRAFNYTFRNNHFGGRVFYSTQSGVLSIHDNHYENCKDMSLTFKNRGIADGMLHLPGQDFRTPPIELKNETLVNIPKVNGTYFKFVNSKLDNVHFTAGKETSLAWFENCELKDTSLTYEAEGPAVNVFVANTKGTLRQEGPGISRKKEIAKLARGNP